MKLIKGINYTILVHDIFPENLVAIGKMKEKSLLYNVLETVYNYSYSRATRCIAIGRDMKEVLESKTSSKVEIIVISNWSDIDDVFPVQKEETKIVNKFELKNKFIFQFAGNLGYAQGLDNIVEAIKLVENENIHFLFIGSGAYEMKIKEFVASNTLKNVTHLGFQNRSEQNDFLNACDVSIVTLSDGMYGLGVPSKSYNIMASDKPLLVIAHEKSEISLCVKENNIGWVVDPEDFNSLAVTFENIYREKVQNNFINIKSSRDIAVNLYSKNIILEKFANLFY
ncbi:glycosyltransferase family 4 protein [Flavobacterium sp. P21]|uniref:glycosyltransferase family 4 protein n=1 Tax=Flavobacterium sp. P21 TaxID=3423948 RepID=UPI003D674472